MIILGNVIAICFAGAALGILLTIKHCRFWRTLFIANLTGLLINLGFLIHWIK